MTSIKNRRVQMRKLVLLTLAVVTLTLSSRSALADTPQTAPTPPARPVQIEPKPAQAQSIFFECPQTIVVGPVNVEAGWRSGAIFPRVGRGISIDESTRQISCLYGTPGENNIGTLFYISRPIPAGYLCKKTSAAQAGVSCELKKPVSR
jgi:hypothetical protein